MPCLLFVFKAFVDGGKTDEAGGVAGSSFIKSKRRTSVLRVATCRSGQTAESEKRKRFSYPRKSSVAFLCVRPIVCVYLSASSPLKIFRFREAKESRDE